MGDVVRAQLVCDSIGQLLSALSGLAALPRLQVVAVNNRFSRPSNGWADISVYLVHEDSSCRGVVAEVQLVHRKLMLVREEMGAHDIYDHSRFAAELLKIITAKETDALPWSQVE